MLIAFEGIDGAGKTTLSKLFFQFLNSRGVKSVWTREPFKEEIRNLLLEENSLSPWGETFLFLSDRNYHVRNLIKPNLEEGFTVITDRYFLSTLAYQGYGRGLDINLLKELNEKALEGFYPDITFLVDIPVEVAVERLKRSGKTPDRFENKEFLQKVREGFLKLKGEFPNIYTLDGTKSVYELLGEVVKVFDKIYRERERNF
jgi:dTMP kinase